MQEERVCYWELLSVVAWSFLEGMRVKTLSCFIADDSRLIIQTDSGYVGQSL